LRHQEQFTQFFASDKRVRIPRCYAEFSSTRVLTMEWLEGMKLSKVAISECNDGRFNDFARRGAEMYLKMIFEHGVYHADPHPGNVVLMVDGAIGLLDF